MPHLENGPSNVAPNDLTGIMRKSRETKEIEVFLKIEIASQTPGVIILVIIMNRIPLLEQKKGFWDSEGQRICKDITRSIWIKSSRTHHRRDTCSPAPRRTIMVIGYRSLCDFLATWCPVEWGGTQSGQAISPKTQDFRGSTNPIYAAHEIEKLYK